MAEGGVGGAGGQEKGRQRAAGARPHRGGPQKGGRGEGGRPAPVLAVLGPFVRLVL